MKLAYIILAHKNPKQVFRLYQSLNTNDTSYFVIHISKASDSSFYMEMKQLFAVCDNVHFCKRENGMHNAFGIVQGTLNAMKHLQESNFQYDYVNLISGQDFPIKSNQEIISYFEENKGNEFISFWPLYPRIDSPFYTDHPWGDHRQLFRVDRFYVNIFGKRYASRPIESNKYNDKSLWNVFKIYIYEFRHYLKSKTLLDETFQILLSRGLPFPRKKMEGKDLYGGKTWWSLTPDCVACILQTIKEDRSYKQFFRYTLIPDEMFFQTVIMNSSFKDKVVNNYLREIEWEGGDGTHPIFFTASHFDRLKNSTNLFARKFDTAVDEEILEMIESNLL